MRKGCKFVARALWRHLLTAGCFCTLADGMIAPARAQPVTPPEVIILAPGDAGPRQPAAVIPRDTLKLPHVIVIPDRIAWRVFDPQPGGLNVGNYFVRMPDGMMFLRPVQNGGPAVRELLQFSRLIKIAESRRLRLAASTAPAVRPAFRAAPVNIAPPPLQAFFDDSTLSAGDVVVAAEGFRVFQGSQNFPWKASDFVTTERWQRDNGTRRGLREMERETARGR